MASLIDYERFKKAWNKCMLPDASDSSSYIHKQLLTSYSEPQRVYHSINHIEHCLFMFDKIKYLLENPDALELSIWFHDVVYEIGSHDNEQLSADHFMSLSNNVLNDSCRKSVYNNVMATLHTRDVNIEGDARYMVDIDLSSFGLPWDEFLQDSDNVRAERSDISERKAYTGQLNFKKTLLECPRFFITDYFYERYELQAKSNLTHYCDMASKKLED